MKRILTIIAAAMISVIATAQTVQSSKFTENTYVTVWGGGVTTQHTNGEDFFWGGAENIVKGVRPLAGLEVGKYVTPVVGFSVEGLAMFNTTGANTIIDQHNVVGNLKLNLSNWIGGYKGEPRRWEVVFVPGLGWGHDYGHARLDRNYLTYNLGAEVNLNLGKARAWQVNIKPVVMWNNYENTLKPVKANMQGRLQVGLTYKFGSKSKKSHNFVLCDKKYTADEYDALARRVAELEAREPEVKEVPVTKEVVVYKDRVVEKPIAPQSHLVTFAIGDATLTSMEKIKLTRFVQAYNNDVRVNIVGSADSKTGTAKRNQYLSEKRAEAVKTYLTKSLGLAEENVVITTALDVDNNAEASRAAVVNIVLE